MLSKPTWLLGVTVLVAAIASGSSVEANKIKDGRVLVLVPNQKGADTAIGGPNNQASVRALMGKEWVRLGGIADVVVDGVKGGRLN